MPSPGNFWRNRRAINGFWEIADIALPSIDDEMDLYGETEDEVVQRFGRRQWKACAIKRGHLGPLSPGSPASDEQFQPAERVIDTTAAGDSFNGGYLAAFLSGRSEMECLTAGHELARKVVQVRGAIAPRDN